MKGSLQIAKVSGIPIQIHWTFGLVIAWVLYALAVREHAVNWWSIGWTTLAVVALFLCVILHELGHALTAKHYGVHTRNILLLPIGGLAVLERLPEQPIQELWVALAGPMVNVMLAVLFTPLLFFIPGDHLSRILAIVIRPQGNFFAYGIPAWQWFVFGLVALNLLVALFNLIPAFPMDGGRILRASLAIRLPRIRATRIATWLGQAFAVLLLGYAFMSYNWAAGIIGVFVFFNAATEYRAVQEDSLLEHFFVRDILEPLTQKIYEEDTMQQAYTLLLQSRAQHFLVFDEWQTMKAILEEGQILEAVRKKQLDTSVKQWASSNYEALMPETPLRELAEKMQQNGQRIFPVYDGRFRLVGVAEEGMLDHFLRLQRKLRSGN